MKNRIQLMRAHMLLAGFLLPIAILYFVSGALYTLDIKGHIVKHKLTLELERPFTPDLERLTEITTRELIKRNLPLPDGEPSLRRKRGSYELRWNDLAHLVTLSPEAEPRKVLLTVRERSWLTQIMRIHRAEAGTMFKLLAVLLASGLLFLFITGVLLAQAIPSLRKPLSLAIVCGLATFVIVLLV